MNARRFLAGALALPAFLSVALAQAPPPLPALGAKPVPQVDAGGPSAAVTALAFGEGGETLYAAGLDKVVRVWAPEKGRFALKTTYRVPLGPGNAGAVNAVALSPDGAWVAMAGRAPMRGEAGFREGGVVLEAGALSAEQYRDAGVIYVASTANPAGGKVLRGHRGEVRALAFAPARKDKPPLLVSAATERDGERRYGGLRLWDAAAGKLLAERNDLPARVTRPGLAAWHTGPGPTQVRVAVAWPEADDKKPCALRLWAPGPGDDPRQGWEADRLTRTVALLGERGGAADLLAGGYEAPFGRLGAWRLSADRSAEARFSAPVTFPPRDGTHFLPVSLAVFSPGGAGAPTHAAVVLQPSADADFRLALVDLRANRVVAELPLRGSDKSQQPAVAARGRYLAVAGTLDHKIRVYAVADLLDGKDGPAAVLTGAGLAPRRVAFVDKGRGLWLSEDGEARPLAGGLVFDLDRRQIRANDRGGLAADAPQRGAWSLEYDADRKGVRVRQGERVTPVRLRGKDEVVTAAALRPPAGGRPGVLAVAYTERDAARTLIRLHDPADGKPFRLLVGHLQDVRALAFSASRPLLASVADDQTVCVWGLADLDRAVGEVPGLDVVEEGKKVVVRRVEAGSAAAKALAAGDVLEKVGAPGAAKPVSDATGFLLAVAGRRPGDEVEVAVAGKGAVKLPVGRGVDERKPLLSLFLLRTRGLPEWVGWSPAGPYDASGLAAEGHLGWQTNTGDAAAPVSFAAARAYRKDYYREGVLRYLAEEADLGRALQKWDKDHPKVPPQPALRPLRPDGALPGERANEYLVRRPVPALRVGLNEDYPLDDQHVLRWRLTRAGGGGVKGAAAEAAGRAARDGRQWRVDLSGVEWRRGEYRLALGLHPRPDGPALPPGSAVTFRFQPPAPVLALRRGGKAVTTTEQAPLVVMEDRLTVDVALEAPARQEVEVRFARSLNGQAQPDAPAAQSVAGARTFPQMFPLKEGLNRLTVRAVNKGALAGHEDEESAAAEVWVSYKAPRELPPRFTGLRLEPEPEVTREGGQEVWVVSRPAGRLAGQVEAEGPLVLAEWSAGGAPKSVLPPREAKVAEFAADLGLKPGELVRLRLRAKSKHSDESTAERRVVYRPPLPAVTIDPLAGPDVLAEKVTLTGAFQAATKDAFNLSFRVTSAEGKVKSFKPEVDLRAGKWKAELSLFPGANTVEAFVGNEWRGERAAGSALTLRYRRPPRITAFPKEVEAVETNKVRLTLAVEGPAGRPLTAVTVDEGPVRFEAGQPETKGDRWAWKVELPEVFVNDGDRNLDRVSVRAVSDEGTSDPAVVAVVHKKKPRPPRARFLRPAAVDTARRPEYAVTFRVESERPLERVEIRGGQAPYLADLKRVEKDGALYVLQAEARLRLRDGANTLELVAVNQDGRSPRAEVVVSYTAPAVLVDVDHVELRTDRGEVERVLRPAFRPDGEATFPTAPRSLVWLAGRVRWSDPRAKALDDPNLQVVVKVGDCRQFPVPLERRGEGAGANVRRFQAPLVLIGRDNRVEVEVPSVGQQEGSRREFRLACAAPTENQRLHVLIVGVDVPDAAGLKARVLDMLGVAPSGRPPGPQGEFLKKPPFERCVLYRVLAGEVDRSKVEAQLEEINAVIRELHGRTGWLNDVVLIYYQGEDVVLPGKKERWLKMSPNFQFPATPPERFALPCHALPRVPGAPLLLLNVAGRPDARAAGPDWGGDRDTGFLRYACADRREVDTADPALLRLLQEAVRARGRLGEVVQYANALLGKQAPQYGPPLVVLDEAQASRRLSEPGR
jgi:WD40 repeat protein